MMSKIKSRVNQLEFDVKDLKKLLDQTRNWINGVSDQIDSRVNYRINWLVTPNIDGTFSVTLESFKIGGPYRRIDPELHTASSYESALKWVNERIDYYRSAKTQKGEVYV